MDLTLYEQMTPDQRAELDGILKRRIVQAIVGRWVPVTDCYDPLAVGKAMLATDAAGSELPLPVAEAGQRGGLR